LENPKAAINLARNEPPTGGINHLCLAEFMKKAKRSGQSPVQKHSGTVENRKAKPARKAGEANTSGVLALFQGTGVDPKDLKDLTDTALAKGINEGLPKIEASIHSARKYANAALKAAIQTGFYLNEAKRRAADGRWLSWLKEKCPNLAQATAYRYMGLARKLSHVINGKPDMTIRQAYIACGIFPDEPPAKTQPPDLEQAPTFAPTDFLAQVRSATEHFQAFQDLPFESLEPSTLDQLTEEWRAMIEVCNELIEKAAARRNIRQVKATVVPPQNKRSSAKSARGG
jgi:hypothetical protein